MNIESRLYMNIICNDLDPNNSDPFSSRLTNLASAFFFLLPLEKFKLSILPTEDIYVNATFRSIVSLYKKCINWCNLEVKIPYAELPLC